jgi:hypothetical protein
MKTTLKVGSSTILIGIFLVACSVILMLFFAIGWLYTYKVFTQQTPVAAISISALMEDEMGQYFNVTVREVKGTPTLNAVFNPDDTKTQKLNDPKTFKLYGDQFDIGGPTIKFKDFLTFMNIDTVYKIAYVRAEYSNIDTENARTSEMTRRHDLNGGYSTWRSVQEDVQNNTFRGRIMKIFIDNLPQINSRGVFVTDQEQSLTLCVTEEGFLFCDKEI